MIRYKSHIATLFRSVLAVQKYGHTLLTLLYATRTANKLVHFKNLSVSRSELFSKSLQQAYFFHKKYQITKGDKVILIGNQSLEWLISLFGLSGLGAEIYLINPKLKAASVRHLMSNIDPLPIFIDKESQEHLNLKNVQVIELSDNVEELSQDFLKSLKNVRGSINNLTSGTTGLPNIENRKLRLRTFAMPLLNLFRGLRLWEHKNVLIGIPCAHGYGLAALMAAIMLKREIYLTQNSEETAQRIKSDKIGCWVTLPTQIEEILQKGIHAEILPKKIITGSEPIDPSLVNLLLLSNVDLYNLFGTTETGILTMATPEMLLQENNTVGKPLRGIKYKLKPISEDHYELFVKSPWASEKNKSKYFSTGDLLKVNPDGLWLYAGRTDEQMLIHGYLVNVNEINLLLEKNFPDHTFSINQEGGLIRIEILDVADAQSRLELIREMKSVLPNYYKFE